ncbi:MAG: hypothetical protein KDA85_08830 [Planctomycetaceae bacterium]|nr:hypothetical protein [Planctomycetaceae bacterium]
MDITGYDNVIFTTADPRAVVVQFFAQLQTRWPKYQFDIESTTKQPTSGEFISVEDLPKDRAEFYVVRDAAMNQHSDEHAYAPMSDGEGPFLLAYDRLQNVNFQLHGVTEPARPPGEIGAPDPYQASLCAPEIRRFTLVTPGDVSQHPFSQWLHQLLCDLARTGNRADTAIAPI